MRFTAWGFTVHGQGIPYSPIITENQINKTWNMKWKLRYRQRIMGFPKLGVSFWWSDSEDGYVEVLTFIYHTNLAKLPGA